MNIRLGWWPWRPINRLGGAFSESQVFFFFFPEACISLLIAFLQFFSLSVSWTMFGILVEDIWVIKAQYVEDKQCSEVKFEVGC